MVKAILVVSGLILNIFRVHTDDAVIVCSSVENIDAAILLCALYESCQRTAISLFVFREHTATF